MFTLVCCNFSKSQGGKIQTLLELSYHSHLKKEGMTAAIAGHRRRGGCSKPYSEMTMSGEMTLFVKVEKWTLIHSLENVPACQ